MEFQCLGEQGSGSQVSEAAGGVGSPSVGEKMNLAGKKKAEFK